MNKGYISTDEPSPLQNHMSCKKCAFVGQNLVKHYVEAHPGSEIPVCLTPKEINTLINNAENPVQIPEDSTAEDDRIDLVVSFLKDLGKSNTFTNPITCPLCSYSSGFRTDIISHLLIHETSNFQCYFCLVGATSAKDFRDHVSVHTGEYAYQCIYCKFCGVSSMDVAQHINHNHPGKEAKTIFENVFDTEDRCLKGYACSNCGYIQMSKSSLTKHVSSVNLFCYGSNIIELDLSKGKKSASTAAVVKVNYTPSVAESSEYIVPSPEAQPAGRNISNLHPKNMLQNRVYIQDEIEIAPGDSHGDSILPFNDDNDQAPILKIKTEKIDGNYNQPNVLQSQNRNTSNIPSFHSSARSILLNTPTVSQVNRPMNVNTAPSSLQAQMGRSQNSAFQTEAPLNKTMNFECASCPFNTIDEAQFIKHAKTDHRSDLSLWCKTCGRCFSNAGVLVGHIKENSCVKEDMIYRCGVKECTFETPSGQTFVHHLRHCHKGSPFIFCVHCQKIFTLPHCLILHMQKDCPYKERNRRTPGQAPYVPTSNPAPLSVMAPVSKPPVYILPKDAQAVSSPIPPGFANKTKTVDPSGRGRARGKVSNESSESDPDDPSWMPSETRRSGRRLSKSSRKSEDSDNSTNKGCPGAFACACCDFSGNSIAVLEDHYLTSHKKPGKIGCLICNLKFESTQNFLDHFVLHKKDSGGNKKISSTAETDSRSMKIKNEHGEKSGVPSSVIQIPYQAVVHEISQMDNKVKNFEELKSKEDLSKMKQPVKLKHFFKCMLYNCTFTTDNNSYFMSHLNDNHYGKLLNCPFCLEEYANCTSLIDHMIQAHGKRCYQCSSCFYRAFSKSHVQIHVKNLHSKEKKGEVFTCTAHLSHLSPDKTLKVNKTCSSKTKTIWPFRCAADGCKFETLEPKEFTKHNETTHRTLSVFICSYCKAEFVSLKRLMNHYRLHGINYFQCTYCLHGSDTKEEILTHISENHADKPIKVHVRAAEDSSVTKDTSKQQIKEQIATTSDHVKPLGKKQSPEKEAKRDKVVDLQLSDKVLCIVPKLPDYKIHKEPSVLQKIYPEHIKTFDNRFSCGIPNCGKEFETVNLYLKHLRLNHFALNIICPYCHEATKNESDFQNHLLFHGPNLYACSSDMCCYNHWKKEEVINHTKSTHGKDLEIVTVREQIIGEPFVAIPEIDCADPKQNVDYSKDSLCCPFCNYRTYRRVMMKKHMYAELEYMRFQCYCCKSVCCTRKELLAHFLSDHPNESILSSMDVDAEIEYLVKTYIFCLQNMPSVETEMERLHSSYEVLPSVNGESKAYLNCRDCQKLFARARDWRNHLLHCLTQHFTTNITKYVKCNYCSLSFDTVGYLKLHSSSSHPRKQLSHSEYPKKWEWMKEKLVAVKLQFLSFVISHLIKNCSGLVFSDLQSWEKNFKLESKLYKCSYCSFNNNFRFNVERHLTSSHNDKPIKIERLTKAFFVTNSPLNICCNNNVSVLDDSKILPVSRKDTVIQTKDVVCGICPRGFPSIEDLKRHAVLDHAFQANEVFPYFLCSESDNLSNEEKMYRCAHCNSVDTTLQELRLHHKSLHMPLPFKARGSLIIDTNSKLKVKCEHCSESFVSRDEFYKHCSDAHPLLPVKEFNEIASDSQKRRFDQLENDSTNTSTRASETPHEAKKLKCDSDLYICCYCHNVFPSLEKVKVHFFVLHPCLPFKYEMISSLLKNDISVSFGVTDFPDNGSKKEARPVTHCKKSVASGQKIHHSNASFTPDNVNLSKIKLQLSVKSKGRSLKFPVVHLSRAFPLFPNVAIVDIMKRKTLFAKK